MHRVFRIALGQRFANFRHVPRRRTTTRDGHESSATLSDTETGQTLQRDLFREPDKRGGWLSGVECLSELGSVAPNSHARNA
eukprot:402082-Rhodomonas_salina.5